MKNTTAQETTSIKSKKMTETRIPGKIMVAVGVVCIILQVLANKSVDLIAKKGATNFEKFLEKFKVLLLGAETNIETPTFMSFFGFIWLGAIGVALFSIGFRLMRGEKLETWVMLLTIGGSMFALSFLCLLFTDASSVFSLQSSTTRTIRIFQHFWHLFLCIPILIASYFAHKFFRKKHAVEFGEATE